MEQQFKPKPLFPTEEDRQKYLKDREEHQRRMETDPEYRALWEEREAIFDSFTFGNDTP